MNMVSTIEIKKLGDVEKGELNNLIPQFEDAFVSDNQRFVRADFDKITTSGELTMRVLCKLSEWCNYPADGPRRKYKELANQISTILFGEKLPKLHSYHFVINDGKLIINLESR